MFCPQCGNSTSEGSAFCAACGCRLSDGMPATPQQPQQYAAAPIAPAPKGNVAQAWSDITSSPNWIKRLLILMLMNCVPVLDLYVSGYNLQWGAEAARGEAKPLAGGCFTKKTILFGLVPLLLSLCFFLAALALLMLCVIPFLGFIACIIGIILFNAFYYAALMRVGATGKISSAFDLSEVFRVYRKGLGSLVFATLIPSIIGEIVVCVITFVIFMIAALFSYGTLSSMSSYTYSYMMNNPLALIGMSTAFLIAFVLMIFVYVFFNGFIELWTMRSVGYWVKRNAPEWASEGVESDNPFKGEQPVVEETPAE